MEIARSALEIHRNALVWDNHVCLPHNTDSHWMSELQRHRAAGANVVMLNIGDSNVTLETQILMAAHFRRWIAGHPEDCIQILTTRDIDRAVAENKLGIGFDVEGAHAISDLSLVSLLYDIGVRWMLMAYNKNNHVAGGCHDDDPGLREFGFGLIEEMDRVGMIKCCSHTGYRSAMDVMDHTDKPVIFSHSNARALHDHPRNIPDDLINACAATGGVVCVNGVGIFLGNNDISPERFVDHVDHVAGLVGIDHVGIGLDTVYDRDGLRALLRDRSQSIWPAGYSYDSDIEIMAPEDLPKITEALLARNYSGDDMEKILGRNLYRVAEQTWTGSSRQDGRAAP